MKTVTTDGQDYAIETLCPYCELNTAGQHQWGCPSYKAPIRFHWLSAQHAVAPDVAKAAQLQGPSDTRHAG